MDESQEKSKPLDIFEVLGHVNANDFQYYSELEEHEQKSLAPYVLMKWMFGTKNKKQLLRLNARVNPYVFALGAHKDLLYKLLCTVSDGRAQRYSWIKTSSTKKSAGSLTMQVIKDFYGYSTKHATEALPILTNDDILEMAQYLGRQSDEISKLKSELKAKDKAK